MKPEELKRRREALTLTQEQLARELDVTTMSVSRWERGIYPIPHYIELALEAIEMRRRRAA
ncbi:MAG TPA: helix-turn-helix domain-containing protein [Pyrinomonadaceae bacterium]|jgi:transcriptional regulator with XRE-family HTH domain